jgi:hypothetical protein
VRLLVRIELDVHTRKAKNRIAKRIRVRECGSAGDKKEYD